MCLNDAGTNLGLDKSRFVDCIWHVWKIIASVHASWLIFTVSHDSLPLLVCRLKTAGSLCRLDRWCFWIRNICGKKVTTGMADDNCIADISPRFGEFCTNNGRVIAQRIGRILPARLFFGCALDMVWRRGRGRGSTVADMGVCKTYLPPRMASPLFDRCGTQFETRQIKLC